MGELSLRRMGTTPFGITIKDLSISENLKYVYGYIDIADLPNGYTNYMVILNMDDSAVNANTGVHSYISGFKYSSGLQTSASGVAAAASSGSIGYTPSTDSTYSTQFSIVNGRIQVNFRYTNAQYGATILSARCFTSKMIE